jgi:hypothetical protein
MQFGFQPGFELVRVEDRTCIHVIVDGINLSGSESVQNELQGRTAPQPISPHPPNPNGWRNPSPEAAH